MARLNHRGYGIWMGIAGALFLIVAIFGGGEWEWRRILCLVAGVLNIAISVREFRRARSSGG